MLEARLKTGIEPRDEPDRTRSIRPLDSSKWLGVYFYRFPLEALSRGVARPGPLAIVEDGNGARIIQCNQSAEARGLSPGVSLETAYARVADLQVRKRDERAERLALEALGAWSGQFTSMVSLEPPRSLLLEVGASERLT
jgi:protein ImuB